MHVAGVNWISLLRTAYNYMACDGCTIQTYIHVHTIGAMQYRLCRARVHCGTGVRMAHVHVHAVYMCHATCTCTCLVSNTTM